MNKSVTEKLRSDHIDLLQRLHLLENENEALKCRLRGIESDQTKVAAANVEHEAVVEETAIREEDRFSGISREKDDLIDSLKKEVSKLQAECKTIRASNEIKLSKCQKALEESDLQSKKLHGLVYQLERDIETLRTQTAVSTTIEDEPLQPRLSVIEDPEGVPYSLPKILCEGCSAFNKDKKGDSTVESVEKLKRKIASLQGKHFEVSKELEQQVLRCDSMRQELDLSVKRLKEIKDTNANLAGVNEKLLSQVKHYHESNLVMKEENSSLMTTIEELKAQLVIRVATTAPVIPMTTAIAESVTQIIDTPREESNGTSCTFEEFVRLKREIKCLKLEILNLKSAPASTSNRASAAVVGDVRFNSKEKR